MKLKSASIIVPLAAVALLSGCARPTHDHATFMAIKAESEAMMRTHSTKALKIPRKELPPVITGLRPVFVTVSPEGIDIVVKPYFDGGYGYYVPKDGRGPPEPVKRYSKLDDGIYWYHPY